jgi:SAM-dependent methyltransferase
MKFKFGKNWQSYAQNVLDAERIARAHASFRELFAEIDLKGKKFLDIGFGQGLTLFLAAEAGAIVEGFDADPDCFSALQTTAKHFPDQSLPCVRVGSILDQEIPELYGRSPFDIVHSWGVLHHTGDMRKAIENAAEIVKVHGYLVLAIYNAHWSSPLWWHIKWLYNKAPDLIKRFMINCGYPVIYLAKWFITKKNPLNKERGMDFYHDVIDWIGGYPYEYAKPEEIREMVQVLGFESVKFVPAQVPTGCNEYVFRRYGSRAKK